MQLAGSRHLPARRPGRGWRQHHQPRLPLNIYIVTALSLVSFQADDDVVAGCRALSLKQSETDKWVPGAEHGQKFKQSARQPKLWRVDVQSILSRLYSIVDFGSLPLCS